MSEEVKFDARLEEGVAYFEQMLQIMPDDRTTLEFLVVAYDQLGKHEKGQEALVSLTKILIRDKDFAALEGLLPRLEASDYAPAQALHLKVKTMMAPLPDLTPEEPKELTEEEKKSLSIRGAVEAELAFADELRKADILDDEAHGMVREHLGVVPENGRLFLVSTLQILEKENVGLFERAVEWLADACGTPPIPLSAFELDKPLVKQYPEVAVRVRGAFPFAKLGSTVLIAVLNPLDETLKAELSAVAPCRMYLASPVVVEENLKKIYGETVS